ncbi:M14 family zinc carboxypeptidase [Streptomyces sp. NPDC018693]|uniref:M14 family zinc carboxypeptidase n=1 Tax=unclassified Streptomyces TaxID=2593676 RepID=UPI0037B6392D
MTTSRRTVITAMLAAPLALLPESATAEPIPGGPWVCGGQPIQLDGLHSNAELTAELERLARQHPDTFTLEVIGHSVENRPLHSATVGTGARKILMLTQVHGDEPLGTEAALKLLTTACADTPAARALREQITIIVVSRINPDGWERYQNRDFAEGIDPRRNSNNIDLNRAFGPYDTTDPALVPEAVAVKKVVAEHEPDLILDYHHQVTYATADGEMATMSVLWSTHPDVDPAVVDDGRRAAVVIDAALKRNGHSTVTLYPRSDTATTARNGLGLDGYPTLLIEQRGQQEAGQKGHGTLVAEALRSMRAVAGSLADGSFDSVDPALAETLPERGGVVKSDC